MHVKLTHFSDGTISVDIQAHNMTGGEVSRLLDLLKDLGEPMIVERLNQYGAPVQNPDVFVSKPSSWEEYKPKDKRLFKGGARWFRKGERIICIPGRD